MKEGQIRGLHFIFQIEPLDKIYALADEINFFPYKSETNFLYIRIFNGFTEIAPQPKPGAPLLSTTTEHTVRHSKKKGTHFIYKLFFKNYAQPSFN